MLFRWLLVSAIAMPVQADESAPEMVTIPRETLRQLFEEYKDMRLLNEKLIRFHRDWQAGTGCT